MKGTSLGLATAFCAILAAPAVAACTSLVPGERLPGETDAQLAARGKGMHQDELRARSDSVFLAQVSAARMVGRLAADYTLTPFFPLYDSGRLPETVLVRDSPLVTSCTVRPELGQVYIVYAERTGTDWRVVEIVRHNDLQDPPEGMPTPRDVARGFYPLPAYGE